MCICSSRCNFVGAESIILWIQFWKYDLQKYFFVHRLLQPFRRRVPRKQKMLLENYKKKYFHKDINFKKDVINHFVTTHICSLLLPKDVGTDLTTSFAPEPSKRANTSDGNQFCLCFSISTYFIRAPFIKYLWERIKAQDIIRLQIFLQ